MKLLGSFSIGLTFREPTFANGVDTETAEPAGDTRYPEVPSGKELEEELERHLREKYGLSVNATVTRTDR